MIPTITYQAARTVAATVENHFLKHHNSVKQNDERIIAPRPNASIIEVIIDIAFWTSLRREEGRSPKISLAFLPPEKSETPLIFQHRLPLTANTLTKLAPTVERSGVHLGVWYEEDEIYIWGTTNFIPGLCFIVEVVEPGLLVIKHRRIDGFGKFINVVVLKGDQVKVMDESGGPLPDCPDILSSMIGFTTTPSWNNSLNILVQLAVAMRLHGRGGTLLVVPASTQDWRESIIHPISYAIAPTFLELAELSKQAIKEGDQTLWQRKLTLAVQNVADLTAVDGATIINDKYEVIAFGAKIGRSPAGSPVNEVKVTEPVIGNEPIILPPVQNGGTRHLSAAQFVHDQPNSMALVASQDGRFTIFSWSPCDAIVHAHRVDSLLL